MPHTPVLQQEIINGLDISGDDTVVDMTLGNGGHASALCVPLESGRLIGIDQDDDALAVARETLEEACSCDISAVKGNFRNIDTILDALSVDVIDKALFDVGMREEQLTESGRGFSFQKDEPLLMTFKKRPTEEDLTAWEIVNKWKEGNIAAILEGYGEERYAKRISNAIIERRSNEGNIDTTSELVEVIKDAVPGSYRHGRIHPATRTFQALRITVNDEIEALKEGLRKTLDLLSAKGRVAVISFHSLEDRAVKHIFKEYAADEKITIITGTPVTPTEEEISSNPKSRSAKLRIAEKK